MRRLVRPDRCLVLAGDLVALAQSLSAYRIVGCSNSLEEIFAAVERAAPCVLVAQAAVLDAIPVDRRRVLLLQFDLLLVSVVREYSLETMIAALRAGCRGVLPEGARPAVQRRAIATIYGGEVWTPHRSRVLSYLAREASWNAMTAELTPRERDVLSLVKDGHTNQEIGNQLFVSRETVRSHVRNIGGKLGYPLREL